MDLLRSGLSDILYFESMYCILAKKKNKDDNQITSIPSEIGQLSELTNLSFREFSILSYMIPKYSSNDTSLLRSGISDILNLCFVNWCDQQCFFYWCAPFWCIWLFIYVLYVSTKKKIRSRRFLVRLGNCQNWPTSRFVSFELFQTCFRIIVPTIPHCSILGHLIFWIYVL
jgi:hypothetical protein